MRRETHTGIRRGFRIRETEKGAVMSKAYVFAAQGCEEIECLTQVDLLRRAGLEVVLCAVGGDLRIRGSHGIAFEADARIEEVSAKDAAALVLPGGMPGTMNLREDPVLARMLKEAADTDTWICAICAAPSVLGKRGLLTGKRAVCFPGFEKYLTGARLTRARVERDGNIVTAVGMGAAVEFGLCILSLIKGEDAGEKMRRTILAPAAVNVL
jgi:4-methyl-5(b-hydroxyethyl)-thiazole monophosphate biosynthesis